MLVMYSKVLRNDMESEDFFGIMAQSMKDFTNKDQRMDMVDLYGQMVKFISVNFQTICAMEMVK